jgi:putative DNA primase/helicase
MDKKINICGERGSGLIKDIEVFKMITGGDWCESENKGQDFISRPAKTKLVFAGNFLPTFENEDDNAAFMERITLFIFQNSVPNNERIINMDDLLFLERNLIVSWAMEGPRRLVQNNFAFSEAKTRLLFDKAETCKRTP